MTSVVSLVFSLFFVNFQAAGATADYYKCTHRESGEWNYGRAPSVCSANPFGPDSTIFSTYPELIFLDTATRTAERTRYVTELSATIRDAAEYYIKKRKPSISAAELTQWKFAIQLVAAHESRLSHYRKTTDTRLKMMRGDYGHGHGLMQIDDRAHFNPVNNGIAWNLITNLTYAMDIYYAQWERAPSQSCVGSATNWKARIRAAWAAYNGGPGSICRFTNAKSAWAANDENFLTMYNNQNWKTFITNSALASSVDAACLIEKKENCAKPGNQDTFVNGKLYQLPDKSTCAYLGGKLQCVTEYRDAICLRALGTVDLTNATSIASTGGKTVVKNERHALCQKFDGTLFAVGAYLKTNVNINLRATPGGSLMSTVPSQTTLQITDFELRNAPVNDRYYQVTYKNQKGYLYAGDLSDHNAWASETSAPSTLPSTLALAGEKIYINNPAGINMRSAPGGTLLRLIPSKSTHTVLEYKIQGTDNEVYYKIKYGSSTGYIYSGSLLPKNSMTLWTKRLP